MLWQDSFPSWQGSYLQNVTKIKSAFLRKIRISPELSINLLLLFCVTVIFKQTGLTAYSTFHIFTYIKAKYFLAIYNCETSDVNYKYNN